MPASDSISILDGSTFVVSDTHGDVEAGPDQVQGLFYRDTRFLSRWVLTVDGRRPDVLSVENGKYFEAQFFLYPPTGTIYENPYLSIIRKRKVGDGFHEDVTVFNHGNETRQAEIRLEAGADFADLFEVKDALDKKGEAYREVRDGELVLGYRRDDFVRETRITSGEPAEVTKDGFVFRLTLAPQSEWTTCIDVRPVTEETVEAVKYGHDAEDAHPNMAVTLEEWIEEAPALSCDADDVQHVYRKSLVDLAALRFYSILFPGESLPAAGLPWFMTIFGRDSLITSYQSLPFTPDLARTALRVLAARQGTKVDDFRDEEPGKILHEIRFGELVRFGERPHSPYFGSADTTPFFLILLDEYERWAGDTELVRALEPNARAALAWIEEYGDRDGDGYVEYQRRNEDTGLENQCWKDSWNSIIWNDGTLAELPRATCEIQGYVYDAKVRTARLAREIWGDAELADRLETDAARLKEQFNRDFWMPERGFFAVALDGGKRRVDTLTSNAGHLLWSGIVDEDKGESVARQLMDDKLFSGWGVRTMAEGEGPYNPIEYHNGTVWPHDNSFIAAGLARYGYREQAARIAAAMFDAAAFFDYRLPETFAGYPRERTRFPVEYPTACSPQAWATGAPLMLLRVLLGLEPDRDQLGIDPLLPDGIERIALRGIPGRWGRTDAVAEGAAAPA
ncbi:MAG TPA: glycogen debranching N-terminal domain-containing protein [Solirubrobacterales bacterium]|nr:glycogen debranching N-terminal domain-containing protein [Solirubrobacterales bacterium]